MQAQCIGTTITRCHPQKLIPVYILYAIKKYAQNIWPPNVCRTQPCVLQFNNVFDFRKLNQRILKFIGAISVTIFQNISVKLQFTRSLANKGLFNLATQKEPQAAKMCFYYVPLRPTPVARNHSACECRESAPCIHFQPLVSRLQINL